MMIRMSGLSMVRHWHLCGANARVQSSRACILLVGSKMVVSIH